MNPASQPSRFDVRYGRAPWQFVLLWCATFGLYSVYWLGRARHVCRLRQGREPVPWWHTLGLLVPLLNLVVFFTTIAEIEGYVRGNGVKVRVPFAALGIASGVISALYRLPDPWWLVSLLAFVPFAAMHRALSLAETGGGRFARPQRMSAGEWTIAVLGGILNVLGVIGTFVTADVKYVVQFAAGYVVALALAVAWSARPLRERELAYASGGRRRPDPALIMTWIVAPAGASDSAALVRERERLRAALVSQILTDGFPTGSAVAPAWAMLLPMVLAGRVYLESYQRDTEGVVDQATRIAALNVFARAQQSGGASPAIAALGARACAVEVALATLGGRLAEAAQLCDFGIATYPQAAGLRWQRGVLRLSGGDPRAALDDLDATAAAAPETAGLADAQEWARDLAYQPVLG